MKVQKPVILIDGSSYLYRAFHALPPLSNSKGEPTGAVYGVVSMISKLLADYDPEYVAVVFDPKGKTSRDEIYTEYKAHRPTMPDELAAQIKPLFEIIHAMGLPLVIVDGIEADDVIGTLAHQAEQLGMTTLVSTGDKDLAQLVNDHITLINTMTGVILDRNGVIQKFNVPPERIIDYLALIGDSVDNIPGIPNVGPKTAVKWLQEYGSLDEIVNHALQIKGKVGENLRQHLDKLPLSKQLVTILTNVSLPQKVTDLRKGNADTSKLIAIYKHLEFRSWLAQLLEEQSKDITIDYQIIDTEAALNAWLERLKQAKAFAFDTETTDLNAISAEIVGISFAINPHEAAYVPLAHNYTNAPSQLNRDWVLNQFKPLLQNPEKIIIGQNLKYDINVLAKYNIVVGAQLYDTMLESYVQNSSAARHNLDSLALKYLGKRTITFEEVAGKGVKQLTFNQIEIKKAGIYAAEDADITLQLHHALWPNIADNETLRHVFLDIEMPLVLVLARMERKGVLLDAAMLQQHSKELSKRLQGLEEQAYNLAGVKFNLGSPKQLQNIFYHKLKLPILNKTPTGQPSTSESVLQELALDYPLPKIILEHRGLSKLQSTYTDRLPLQINPQTGRIHTSYNQAVTTTGRLSSTEPNLQNIPIRNEEGRRIRQAFIAPKGYKIVSADYSQIELRIMAHFSQDPGLLKAFENNLDIHKATAAEVFNIAIDAVTEQQRRSAKAINFGLIYGMSAFGLARQLGIDRGVAQQYIDLYFERYPGIKNYMEKTRALARRQGFVETLNGRRLYSPDINASNLQRRRAAERAAINAPLQGTAADIIKLAMIKIDAWLQQSKIDAAMILQVHDELVFEIADKDVADAIPQIKEHMVNTTKIAVPLIVAVGVGSHWDEAH
jgi:DNA polymerase I